MDLGTQQAPATKRQDEGDYEAFIARLQSRFEANTDGGKQPLFTTDAVGLFDEYLAKFAEGDRQFHTCHACRRFVETYGGLVVIDAEGRSRPAVWDWEDAPEHYQAAIARLMKLVGKARVTGVFLSSERAWGLGSNPDRARGITWHHFSLKPCAGQVYSGLVKNAHQAMAEKREDHHTVARALADFKEEHVEQALQLLRTEALYRSEKVLGAAEWLAKLHADRAAAKGHEGRDNVLWKAVATAPAGFCHPRSGMIGTLLEDIAAGKDFADVSRSFSAKMRPDQYQRPQAPPTAGNIAQAEDRVAKMGIAASLRRRFATVEELEALWRPTLPKNDPPGGGVFGHLKPMGAETVRMDTPAIRLTWVKFAASVLPEATGIEFYVPGGYANFGAFVTAADMEAPPILQWDSAERRNPFSVYVYTSGSPANRWSLNPGWCPVTAAAHLPSMWHDAERFKHQSRGVMFVLAGARDTRVSGLALFPENLRSELHDVRSTIEAFSRRGSMEGVEQASACGIILGRQGDFEHGRLRVTSGKQVQEYKLDRWD